MGSKAFISFHSHLDFKFKILLLKIPIEREKTVDKKGKEVFIGFYFICILVIGHENNARPVKTSIYTNTSSDATSFPGFSSLLFPQSSRGEPIKMRMLFIERDVGDNHFELNLRNISLIKT